MKEAAEQAHAVDAATRPQDRCFFESQNRLERDPDLLMAAQLMGRPLGALPERHLQLSTALCYT